MQGTSTSPHHTNRPERTVGRRLLIGTQAAFGAAILFVACSSGGDDSGAPADSTAPAATGAAADTTASTDSAVPTTTPTTNTAAATTTTTEANSEPDVQAVSFAADVQPILESNCASCHTADGPGTVHLDMSTAGSLLDADGFDADYIDAVISVGFMPPWPAADGDVAFHDDRRLDPADIETIADWAEAGGDIDVDPETPIVPARQVVEPIDRDIVLQGGAYKGSIADPDDYRCQIYDPALTGPGFVQGYDIEADRTEVVHHGLLFKANADIRADADARDAEDPAEGWSCTGLAGIPGVNQILSWAPGQAPTSLPEDTGIAVDAGDFFVVQIHYHYEPESAALEPDQSTLVVDLADADVIAANGGSLDPVNLTLYLGPAEIPCSTDEVGPLCDRDAAIADLSSRSGTLAGGIADALMRGCGATVEDFAGMTDGIASSSCDIPAAPGQIISVWGHEHEIGKAFRMTLNPDTPDEIVLLDIPNWNFDWQLDYSPVDDIVLVEGDVIRVECTWDRSKIDEDAEPRYVLWAEGTNDEMCYSQIVTRPA